MHIKDLLVEIQAVILIAVLLFLWFRAARREAKKKA